MAHVPEVLPNRITPPSLAQKEIDRRQADQHTADAVSESGTILLSTSRHWYRNYEHDAARHECEVDRKAMVCAVGATMITSASAATALR